MALSNYKKIILKNLLLKKAIRDDLLDISVTNKLKEFIELRRIYILLKELK